jgi:hypothetical protein
MTRFQELLEPNLAAPGEEQERASRKLQDLVKSSRLLHWWTRRSPAPDASKYLLVVVAPYSQYDLALLDVIDEVETPQLSINNPQSIPVYVFNVQLYQSIAQLSEDIPAVTRVPHQSPVVALWENGGFRETEIGKSGRDLVAKTLGLPPKEFNDQVIARVPKSIPESHGKG